MSSYNRFASCYDLLTQNIDYKKRAEYFDKIIKQNKVSGKILVDLACGTGTLSECFEDLGYDVVGVDISEQMLSVAMDKKFNKQSNIIYLNQSMQELDLFGTIDIAVCALDSINHLTKPEDVISAFLRVSLFLSEDGIFIFDVNSVYKQKEVLSDNTFVYDCEDVYCVWQNTPKENNITEISLDFFEYDDKTNSYYRYKESFCERAYTHEEILSFMETAGLELIALYGDDSFCEPSENTQRLIYVTRNKEFKNGEYDKGNI